MQLGIFAKTFAGDTPSAVLSAARRAGYDAVQYNMACSGLPALPLVISEAQASAVGAASVETGVAIAAVSATYNMIHPDARLRDQGRRAFAAIAAAASRMRTRLLTVCTGTRDPHDQWKHHPDNRSAEAWNELLDEFDRLLPVAEEHDVDLGVEPEHANVVDSAPCARRLLDTLASPRVRIVFDAANLFEVATLERQHRLVSEAADLLGGEIAIAHAKDRLPDGRFTAAGSGVLDYAYYLRVLQSAGFAGPLITHGLEASGAEPVCRFLRGRLNELRLVY